MIGEIEEDGLAPAGSQMDKEMLDQIVSKLESKIVEKESVIESLESDFKTLKTKFDAINDELKLTEEERDNLVKKLDQDSHDLKEHAQESRQLRDVVESMTTELSHLRRMESNFNKLDQLRSSLEEQNHDLVKSIEDKETKISSLEKEARLTSEDKNIMDEKYKDALKTIEDLERQKVQHSMDAESVECSLKEEKRHLKAQNISLENEISSLHEKIEASENNFTDLRETLSKLSERRNSLDATVTSLQSTIAQQKEELETCQSQIDSQEAQRETFEHLTQKIDDLTQQLRSRSDELDQITIARDNLLSETETLKSTHGEAARLEQELVGMREMIQAVTGENETLLERIGGLEARPQPPLHPPPDITGHHNPPDVAVSSNNNPDIMFVSGASSRAMGANPDIMDLGGQNQEAAQGGWDWGEAAGNEAANWFDNQVNIYL